MDELTRIANFLGQPVSEVMRHAGVSVDSGGIPSRVLLAALITEKGTLTPLKDPRPLPQDIIDRAQAAMDQAMSNERIIAAQIRAKKGTLAMFDDAIVLFQHTEDVDRTAIGSLSICRTKGGQQFIARVLSARKTGEAQLFCVDNQTQELMLETASSVIAILP